MSPAYVQPYVKAQKNDERNAEAIAEAATRPTMRYVEIKSEAQLEVQSLHRVRGRLVAERTALINQLRALMLERGIAVAQGRSKLERYLPEILADERSGLGPRLRRLIEDMREEWRSIDQRINGYDNELAERVRNEDAATRLIRIPGIGVLTATALVAAVGKMLKRSAVAVTWRLGWDWCRARRPQVENRGCCTSASAATVTCGCY